MSVSHQPQWFLSAPSQGVVEEFLRAQAEVPFSYPETGESNGGSPAGYIVDHTRARLGQGAEDFSAACAALRDWRMFPAGWTKISPTAAPIVVGQTVAMQAKGPGLWWLNACRIVYVIDETVPVRRFGFAYGTLLSHVEQGEERFSVELHPDGSVWYDLRAFSRPRFWAVRLAKPLARKLQRRFVQESLVGMQQAVTERRRSS